MQLYGTFILVFFSFILYILHIYIYVYMFVFILCFCCCSVLHALRRATLAMFDLCFCVMELNKIKKTVNTAVI